MTHFYTVWGQSRVKLRWHGSDDLPPLHLITSVHGFCYLDSRLLLVDLRDRGWDFPGGHIEPREMPESCFKREALEEGYVEGDCKLLGHISVDHSECPNWTENSRYPKIGYQVFYRMDIAQLHPFEAEFESARRIFINPAETQHYYKGWNPVHKHILEDSLELKP
ncbi:NUDIX domain-containing protein [Paenibacillus sp. N3/727]|uniref:NUDIX hydrolase n=1 Tax=Paenibacillus sp. N3/727 TaxID=2925845 RepID=UPI001F536A01|nr:NUDIX domain-containing protein [Paenibacillus sp. N3/727]UNK19075.1 NUDIX domain-containing protein [Paenibacillus sp. N3/727]